MSDIVSFSPVRALDRNGDPVPGAQARFYRANTTTPATVYQDVAEEVPHPVPVEADADGVFPPIYRSGVALKVVVESPSGVVLPGDPLDPVITVSAAGGAAEAISFEPTGNIPVTDVQAAIEFVFDNAAQASQGAGIGVTGEAPLLANLNATGTPSGVYRWDDTTTGDFPVLAWEGLNGSIWWQRENASNGIMFIARRDQDALYARRLSLGAWQPWRRYDIRPLFDSDWTTGTSEDFATPSPKQIADAITARELSEAQVSDPESEAVGTVSGELLAVAVSAFLTQTDAYEVGSVALAVESTPGLRDAGTTVAGSALRVLRPYIRGTDSIPFLNEDLRASSVGTLPGEWRRMHAMGQASPARLGFGLYRRVS